jgi:hypothetical protein
MEGTVRLKHHSIGIAAAKNVLVSVYVTNATLTNFFSAPYMPENVKANTTSYGNGYAKINILPSQGEIKMTALVNTVNSPVRASMRITPFVFSDEGVGKFGQSASIFFYILLGIIIIFLLVQMHLSIGIENVGLVQLGIGAGIILAYMGVFYIAYMIIYGGWTIYIPTMKLPTINVSSLPPVKTLLQIHH